MATFGQILAEIQQRQREGISDPIRRRYLQDLSKLTGRNVIVYYSAFIQRPEPQHFFNTQINDEDKHGFMASFAGLDFNKGLDLIMHTPGGDIAATESIIEYIRSKFERDVRVIVPQISMSGGTIIALAAKEIVMGRHSNLGPIDPQIGGRPAVAILEEFERARNDIINNPNQALLWQPILQQYNPTLLSQAQQSIEWAREICEKTLKEGMLFDDPEPDKKSKEIVDFLLSRDVHKAHGRHLHRNELRNIGINITDLESDQDLQDAVLSVHHACMLTVGNFNAVKLIENHNGIAHMKILSQIQIPVQSQQIQPQPQPHQPPSPPQKDPNVSQMSKKISLFTRIKIAIQILLGRIKLQ